MIFAPPRGPAAHLVLITTLVLVVSAEPVPAQEPAETAVERLSPTDLTALIAEDPGIETWQQAAALPFVEVVPVAGGGRAAVLDGTRPFAGDLTFDFTDGTVLVSLHDGPRAGISPAAYGALAADVRDRIAFARERLVTSGYGDLYRDLNDRPPFLDGRGGLAPARHLTLSVTEDDDEATTGAGGIPRLFVKPSVSFRPLTVDGPIVIYWHGVDDATGATAEHWEWRVPAEGEPSGDGLDGETRSSAAGWVRTKSLSGDGTVHGPL